MAPPTQQGSRNRLLCALSQSDYKLIQPHLEFVTLDVRMVLETPNQPITDVYFPEHGMVSIVANGPPDKRLEVGIVGWEGMSGLAIVLGGDRSPHATFIQIEGSGHRLACQHLRVAMEESRSLLPVLLRYVQAFMVQQAYTSLTNRTTDVTHRLARWLLMAHDRVDGDNLPLVHEFLGLMLGVRREAVTLALQRLEGDGYIRSSRARITIRDRDGLEALAGELYGVPEAELDRLIG